MRRKNNEIFKNIFISLLISSSYTFAQEADVDAPTNLDKLLELVKEGKSKEQSENTKREAEFTAGRDQQDQILRQNKESLPDKKELLTSLRKNLERIKKS